MQQATAVRHEKQKYESSLGKQRKWECFTSQTIFCLCQTSKSTESFMRYIKNTEAETPFFLLWERVCTNQVNHPRSESIQMNVYSVFLGGCFFTFESMHMIYEYWASGKNTFISSSKCQTQKQLGLHRRSALVILNVIRIERGSKLERNERLGEERQLEWACIWERGRQSMIEDGVRGLAKQPWCNLSSCSWSFAASSRQSLFSLTSLLPPVQ